MPYNVPIEQAKEEYPEYNFIKPLTPSEQKAAFHVKDGEGRDLCFKIISPDYDIDRLDREIMALQTINHPNIVKLVEHTRSSKPGRYRHYIVEEYIEGTDLGDMLHAGQQWTRPQASSFFAQLFDGLYELGNQDIVHRDLKPSNIRVRPTGSPVIVDFGLARLLNQSDITSTSEGAAIGTTRYFSPEQCIGTKYDIDRRTDLFAAGVLLYEALIGTHPFWHGNLSDSELRDAICNSYDYLSRAEFTALPKPWKVILERLLNKERVRRPDNASQVATVLRQIGGI